MPDAHTTRNRFVLDYFRCATRPYNLLGIEGTDRMPQSRLSRHVIGRVADIPPGSRRIIEVSGRSIGVFNVNGTFYAVRNKCPHQGGPLCLGVTTGLTKGHLAPGSAPDVSCERDGEIIRCPWHAWEFDMRTGNAVFGEGVRVKTYETLVRKGEVPPPVETYTTVVESDSLVVEVRA